MSWLLRHSLDHPRWVLLAVLALTGFLAAGLPRLELRTDGEMLRPVGSPEIEVDRGVSDRFRDPRWIWMLVQAPPQQAGLGTPSSLGHLRELHAQLARLAVLQPDRIHSLASLPRLAQSDEGIRYTRQLDEIPADPEAVRELLAELDAQPIARGLLLSADARRALFALPLSETTSVREAVAEVAALARREASPELEILLGGPLIAETTLGDAVLRDLATLVPIMIVVMSALLALTLRCVGGVLIPMLEAGLVLIWTFGAMAWCGVPVTLVTTILPVVLMAMAITDEIHLLERLLAAPEGLSQRTRIEEALQAVGRPILLTSLTTAAGFLSFLSASIPPLRHFGLFAAFGILAAMLLTFSAIPALALLMPEGWLQRRSAPPPLAAPRFARLAASRPGLLFALGAAAFVCLAPGLLRLRASDSWVENFSPDAPVVAMERAVNESFWGSYRFDLVLEAEPGFFRDPAAVGYLTTLREAARTLPHIGGVETPLDALETISAHLADGRSPDALSSGELFDLFSVAEMTAAGERLRDVMTGDAALARLRLHVRSADYERAVAVRASVEELLGRIPPPPGVRALHAGDLVVATAMVEAIVRNQLRSIAWALVAVALILVAFAGGLSALPAMVPVLFATGGLLAAMGLFGVELGIATSMFAALSVGVGVDFGIHFAHRYHALRRAGNAASGAIVGTFAQAGRALAWNATVLAGGFAVLVFSELYPNHALGLLLASATLACWGAAVLLLPWLLSRRPGVRGVGTLLCASLALGAPPAHAESDRCPGVAEPEATRLMEDLEQTVRRRLQVSRMQAITRYLPRRLGEEPPLPPSERVVWSVVDGDLETTSLLFVFTAPGRMAGTSLLVRDLRRSSEHDETWFYLSAFDRLQRLEGDVERTIVPGTALTYEDARGFLASDRYAFRFPEPPGPAYQRVVGCPRTPEMAERLGYGAIEALVDREQRIVTGIDYRGLGGAPLKRYEVIETVSTPMGVLPKQVRLVHHRKAFENDLHYEYWPLEQAPGAAFFAPEAGEAFLDRLRGLLHRMGLGPRIDAEIAEAEARVRAYRARFGGTHAEDGGTAER